MSEEFDERVLTKAKHFPPDVQLISNELADNLRYALERAIRDKKDGMRSTRVPAKAQRLSVELQSLCKLACGFDAEVKGITCR